MTLDELTTFAEHDLPEAERLILQNPGLLKLRSTIGETPLHYLVVENKIPSVKLLITKGSDVNTKNEFYGTPLLDATSLEYLEMCSLLLRHGAAIETMDNVGHTPISMATAKGNSDLFNLLYAKSKLDINIFFDDVEAQSVIDNPDNSVKKLVLQMGLKSRYI